MFWLCVLSVVFQIVLLALEWKDGQIGAGRFSALCGWFVAAVSYMETK